MHRGEVYWADLNPRSGSEQQGHRPVLLISNDGFNQAAGWKSLIVVPISASTKQLRRSLTTVVIPSGIAGLSQESIALGHQVTTLDKSKLHTPIGVLPSELLGQVEQALKAAMNLP